ncbi:tetratricopeptide repeat protein 31 [Pristis pectinata]|uniref:tetratricopeptide repeat protein 31 n=1 Tax=Pristis pectinata TaxID=685728 RepID=UPI00223CC381|nr:tetratricopeptide repeat protein 31 [Pristis pectinata]XP_051866363.1 tetratricopeptide repeat protein 31 [Pristis pectinata]
MSDRDPEHIDPSWWLEDEDHFLLPLKHKVNIYQHNQQDNPTVNTQNMETLFKNMLEDNPVNVHQFLFNEESAITQLHVFDSSEEDGTYDDEDEDDSNDGSDQRYPDTFCGLRRSFLCDPPVQSAGLKNISNPYYIKGSNSYRGSAEEAERIGQELVQEEEQAKRKAEKRRLKKKRQKERRRQQKLEKENRSEGKIEANVNDKEVLSKKESCTDGEQDSGEVGESINNDVATSPEKGPLACKKQSTNSKNGHSIKVAAKHSKVKRDREGESESTADKSPSQSEDEWDMSSSFVSKAANQIKRKMNIKPKAERKEAERKKAEKKLEHPVDSNTLNAKILELAVQGNSMANKGRYEDAVGYFTEAIKYDPKEYRLFGNRSYCYERLQQYSRALNDAHIALTLNPSWPKGYFRKARALAGVKRYAEAIEAFREVLRIDSSCKDAEFELLQVQTKLMMERGFTQQQCEETLKIHGSFEQALEVLFSSAQKPRNSHINSSISIVDGDDKDFVRVKKHSNQQKNKPVVSVSAQHPRKLFPIWIGNVTTRITEESLRMIFETVGTIHSIRMLQDRFCAFINFTTKQGAERAIAELQGIELEGTKLVIRHPDNNYKNLGAGRAGAAR